MTQSLESLSRRITSMQGIRSVVHTMKSLSVINSAPYEQAARAIEAYHETVLTGLHALLSQSGPIQTAGIGATARIIVVFGSDHGLCGNYNEALAEHVHTHIAGDAQTDTTVLCIGAQMEGALSDMGVAVHETFLPPASVDGIGRLANLLTQKLDDLRRARRPHDISVTLAYFARSDLGAQAPKVDALLPLDPDLVRDLQSAPWVSRSLPHFSMAPEDLFIWLIRGHLFASLFHAAAEALVTENAARLALMQQAEQSVDDKLDALKSETRALRQNEITTELLDVIIGFEALKKERRPDQDVDR
ncbi:F-type H+-transporting ATPase subunit gamma [Sulfitobacter marinus]|uniref:F-type H+-transporting ATPase subunit gamma n=1 Tax=Sulfitobacter marinus TaxID=394264 RepID=A0A1I6VB76_9RHOB|nr:FoF1 ATP synthase subunit gamma [Sulfitobacter marinus]SFT10986.1 F-type H+-transporting ATPase subunit gamma [Sulfitobacter marinus]